jgi:GEVED domain/Secretion system C-terminal sorting domain
LFFRPNLTATKTLVGNFTTTSASINLTGFNATFYITIVSKNDLGAAIGCVETSFTTEADPFVPYCSSINYSSDIEPITSVNFAGINNTSDDEIGGSPSIQNFISLVGTVATGIPYTMTLKGNTGGSFTNNFRVFIDWNKDNDFADAGETFNAGTIASSTGTDAITAVSTITVPATALLGTTRMRVKKLFGTTSIDDACLGGGFGQTEDYTLNVVQSNTTTLTTAACNSTLPLIYSTVYAIPKSGVTGYRFEVSNVLTPLATPQTIDKPLQFFQLTELASYDYATTYSVRVMLKVGTQWLGYYGAPCTVTTPGVLVSPTVGPATVTSPACGSTLVAKSATIYTTPQSGVTGYRFRVVKSGSLPATGQIIDRTLQFFSFNDVTAFVYNTVYTVEVSYKTTGDYLPYGTPCTFTTPMPLVATTTCGATIATTGGIYAKPLASAISYRFEVTNLGDEFPTGVLYTRPTQLLSASLIPSYSSANSYSVRVAVETTAGVSPFGDACTINPAAAARQGILSAAFTAVAYPNPFETNFTLNVTSASDDKVTVAVYDMIGKMLESKEVNASELQAIEIGTNYQSGVYNVVVSQGENVKSIRMVKR